MSVPAEKMDITKELEAWKGKGANLLMPSIHIAGLSEFHAPVIETVQASITPDDGDVYEDTVTKKLRPTKQLLMKLSFCAGIIWSPTETKRTDNRSDRNYISFQAVGGIKKADGTPVFFKAEYDMDFEVIEYELRALYEGKTKWLKKKENGHEREYTATEKKEYVDYCVTRDLIQKRKHGVKLCEAGAMNRVVREILGLKQGYTKEELSKPFVMARIVFRPDYNDKEVKKALIDAHIKSMMGIYGPGTLDNSIQAAETIDITPGSDDPDPDSTSAAQPPPADPPAASLDSQIADFQNMSVEDQSSTLYKLARDRDYNIQEYLTKIKKAAPMQMKPEKRLELFKHLLSLVKPEVEEDDVPF